MALFGGMLQRRHEHKKWVKEQRVRASLAYLNVIDLERKRRVSGKTVSESGYSSNEIIEALGQLMMVSPPDLILAARTLQTKLMAIKPGEMSAGYYAARREWLRIARRHIGINGSVPENERAEAPDAGSGRIQEPLARGDDGAEA